MLLESLPLGSPIPVGSSPHVVAHDTNHNVPMVSLMRRLPELHHHSHSSEPQSQLFLQEEKTLKIEGESEVDDDDAEEDEEFCEKPQLQQQEENHNENDETEKTETILEPTTPTPTTLTTTTEERVTKTSTVTTTTSKMADKRRYYERDSRSDNNNSFGNHSESGRSHSQGGSRRGYGHGGAADFDGPPNSRLFILCGRSVTEEELRAAFEKFGDIKELWIVKEKSNGESKGVAYITYSKTSEAALAMEEMNGKFIGTNTKSLKVLIANSRDQGSRRETNEEERLHRLFIIVPKAMTELELKDQFAEFGDVEHCNIVRERNTKESKGYAYVTFHRISHAAKAYEGCDRSFKPKFADPRPQKQLGEDRYSSAHGSTTGPYDVHEYNVVDAFPQIMSHHHHDQHSHIAIQHSSSVHAATAATSALLTVVAHGSLNQDQLWRLCDFFPGLDYCNVRHDSKTRQCYASVVYNSPQSAAYAKDKLHGFEYPPGNRLIVKFEANSVDRAAVSRYSVTHNGGVQSGQLVSQGGRTPPLPDMTKYRISEPFAQAQTLLQPQGHHMSSYPQSPSTGESYDPSYCSVKLPAPQPLAPMDSGVMERLFVVCHPSPPQLYALKDVFGRFGNLIDIFMLNGKNFGYAKYANKTSADDAKSVLHGQEVCGMRLKVFHAEPQDHKGGGSSGSTPSNHSSTDQKSKRLRIDSKGDDMEYDSSDTKN